GIRDRNVTGVQTCALPISNRSTESTSGTPGFSISRLTRRTGPRTRLSRRSPRGWGAERPRRPPRGARLAARNETRGAVDRGTNRSEERRVGKEGRDEKVGK